MDCCRTIAPFSSVGTLSKNTYDEKLTVSIKLEVVGGQKNRVRVDVKNGGQFRRKSMFWLEGFDANCANFHELFWAVLIVLLFS